MFVRAVVGAFFGVYFLAGLCLFRDYGVSWDEAEARSEGVLSWKYALEKEPALLTSRGRHYGVIFEMLLVAIEKALNLSKDPRALYFMRHFVTFTMFYTGLVFFYRLGACLWNSRGWGLAGSFFLAMSPRIFADSFYNSKDIPFLAMMIISLYTLVRLLNEKTVSRTVSHAAVCALLTGMRIPGVMVILMTVLFMAGGRKLLSLLALYLVLVSAGTVLIWPVLWDKPLYHFVSALRDMSRYGWPGHVLYLGNEIKASSLPWHYIPVWIIISTPLSYMVCFVAGCFASAGSLSGRFEWLRVSRSHCLILLAWFFIPLAAVVIFKSVLYDAWRQLFFIYPALILIALGGLSASFGWIREHCRGRLGTLIPAVIILAVSADLFSVARFMIRAHPYQNVYFNRLAGRDMNEIKSRFELDYWGLSYRKALEEIVRRDADPKIKIFAANFPGEINSLLLAPADRRRLVYVQRPEEAKYFLSNYRGHKEEYAYPDEFYSIKVDGAKIMVVYRMTPGS